MATTLPLIRNAHPPAVGVVTLATGYTTPLPIAVDSTLVYFTSNDSNHYTNTVPIGGGSVTTNILSGQINADGVFVDSTSIYFLDNPGLGTQRIRSMPVGGGSITTLATLVGAINLQLVGIDATNIYFRKDLSGGSNNTFWRMTLAGGTPVQFYGGTGFPAPAANGFCVLGGIAYFLAGDDSLCSAPISAAGFTPPVSTAGNFTVLATSVATYGSSSHQTQIAVDATSVYVADITGTRIRTVPIGGGSATTLASGLTAPQPLIIDATSVYFGSGQASGTIKKSAISGGAVTTLASAQALNQSFGGRYIALDSASIYWSTQDGKIRKIAK